MKKVAICIPSGDMVHADFAMALAAMTYRCSAFKQDGVVYEGISLALINTKGSLVVNNRNKLVDEARTLGVDYVFFVDSDVVLHPWTLRRLLDAEKDIVGGTYAQREEPHWIMGQTVRGEALHEELHHTAVDVLQLMEVGRLPGGCLLVKMSVFDKLRDDFDLVLPFQTPSHEATVNHPAYIEGEDYFFCRNARMADYSIYLDWSISAALGHVGQKVNTLPLRRVEQEPANAIVH